MSSQNLINSLLKVKLEEDYMAKSAISDGISVESAATVVLDQTERALIRVLHVDGENSLSKVVKQCLEMQGKFQVDIASSVEEAMKKMEKETYDVIVSDYKMPKKDGLELLRELREKENNIPFIIFTDKGREEVAINALNLGADQYLDKTGDSQTVYCELAHGIRQAVEKKRAEGLLKESEALLRQITDNMLDMISLSDEKGIFKYVSPSHKRILGYETGDLLGKSIFEFMHPDDLDAVMEAIQIAKKNHSRGKMVFRYRHADGHYLWLECIGNFVFDENDQVIGVVLSTRDITERKKAEESLQKSRQLLEKTFVNLQDAIFIIDADTKKIIDCNPVASKIFGYAREEMLGKTTAFLHANEASIKEFKKQLYPSVNEKGFLFLPEFKMKRKDGTLFPVEHSVMPIENEQGRRIGWVGVVRDVTERKKSEQKIRESQEKFERLFTSNPEAAAYMDPDFHILDVNRSFEELFGYSSSEVKGRYINHVIVPKDKMEEAEMLNKKTRKEQVYHDTVRKRKDGSLVSVSISSAPINVEGKLIGYMELYKDITARNEVEKELEESRRHFQTLFNLMVDPVAIVDGKGKILEVTQRAEEVTGFKREELVGKNFLKTEILSAKSKAILIKNLAKRMMGMRIAPYEVEVLTKDGRKLPHEINAAKIEYNGKPADLVVFRDVTERKKMEEKLRVVGSLTRHDVRNKLSVVTGNVFLAKKKLAGNDEVSEYLREIESGCQQIVRILEFSKDYEMLGVEELTYINVNETFEKAISLFSNLDRIRIENECRGLVVLADSLLRQVFYNLVDNSLKHGERVGRIRAHYEEAGKDQLSLVYEDDGVGIPLAEKPKLFKEGYGRGTGYGLFMIKRICEVYGWSIQETGEPGKGAHFTMTIPRTNQDGKQNYQLRHHF